MKTETVQCINKITLCVLAAVTLVLALSCFSSCGALFPQEEGVPERVLADSQYVEPQVPVIPTGLPVLDSQGENTGRSYVIVSEADLPATAPRLSIEKSPKDVVEQPGFLSFLGGLRTGTPLDPFLPLLGYIATKFVASGRSRKQAGKGLRQAATLDLKGALVSFAQAEGWAHIHPPPQAQEGHRPA